MSERTMAYGLHKNTLIAIHTTSAPGNEEWQQYMQLARSLNELVGDRLEQARIIVLTDGGSPNVKQRNDINEWMKGSHVGTAVICHAGLVRGAVTALNWFNKHIQAFSPENWDAAMRHLGIQEADQKEILTMIRNLVQSLPACRTVTDVFEHLGQRRGA